MYTYTYAFTSSYLAILGKGRGREGRREDKVLLPQDVAGLTLCLGGGRSFVESRGRQGTGGVASVWQLRSRHSSKHQVGYLDLVEEFLVDEIVLGGFGLHLFHHTHPQEWGFCIVFVLLPTLVSCVFSLQLALALLCVIVLVCLHCPHYPSIVCHVCFLCCVLYWFLLALVVVAVLCVLSACPGCFKLLLLQLVVRMAVDCLCCRRYGVERLWLGQTNS